MYFKLLGSQALRESTSVAVSAVLTGARFAIASGPSLSLVDISVCDRFREGLRANTLLILLIRLV